MPEAEVPISVALPFRFDTSPVVKLILRGVLALLLLVIVPGLLYSLLVSRDTGAAVLLLVIGLMVIYFGRVFLRNLVASHGTITADSVLVEPGILYGIRLQGGPSGRFPVESFEAVRVERIAPLAWAQGGPHERVSLVGKKGTPDILIAKTSDEAGRALGRDLSAALGLLYQERSAPY